MTQFPIFSSGETKIWLAVNPKTISTNENSESATTCNVKPYARPG